MNFDVVLGQKLSYSVAHNACPNDKGSIDFLANEFSFGIFQLSEYYRNAAKNKLIADSKADDILFDCEL